VFEIVPSSFQHDKYMSRDSEFEMNLEQFQTPFSTSFNQHPTSTTTMMRDGARDAYASRVLGMYFLIIYIYCCTNVYLLGYMYGT
jgi:hypothetical protein